MKKIIAILFITIFWTLVCAGSGYFYAKKMAEPIVITQKETVWKDKIVYRDYLSMPPEQMIKKLRCYDQDEFYLTFKPLINPGEYRIEGKLCEREALKDIKIEVNSGANWKYCVGAGVAVAITGFLIYKLK